MDCSASDNETAAVAAAVAAETITPSKESKYLPAKPIKFYHLLNLRKCF